MLRFNRRFFLCLSILLLGGVFLSFPAAAWEPEGEVDALLSFLPPAIREAWEDSGETSPFPDGDVFLTAIREAFLSGGSEILQAAALLLVVTVLAALSERLLSHGKGAVRLLFSAAAALLLLRLSEGALLAAGSFLSDASQLSVGMAPVFASLYAAGGNSAAAVASAGSFSALLFFLELLAGTVFFPFFRILFALALLTLLGENDTLSHLSRGLRRIYTTALVLLSILFSVGVGAQTLLAQAKDGLSGRSLKFMVGNMIPVVGSAVSGALGTVAGSLSFLRTAGGGAAVAGVLLLSLPVVLRLLALRLLLSLLSGAATLLSADGIAHATREFTGIADLALATVSLSSAALILLSAALMKCAVPLA